METELMQQLRELLPQNLWQLMNRKLGPEEMLRLLWPALVGPKLALQIHPRQLRGKTLIVAIPDGEWRAPLESLESTILESLDRFLGQSPASSVELVVEPCPFPPQAPPANPGNFCPRQGMQPLRGVTLDGAEDGIEDERLRDAFLWSAQKYFDRPQAAIGKELGR
jgi:Dna[CI] antecedent, DciA